MHASATLIGLIWSLRRMAFCLRAVCALMLVTLSVIAHAAETERIINPVAVFNGLDKITGRIVSFEVAINETVQFGSLHLTPRVCYTRPPTEAPNTTAFIEVDELSAESGAERLFTGWIFAASPGLHGIEHPVYDIWLTDCQGGTAAPIQPHVGSEAENGSGNIGSIDPNAPPLPPSRAMLGPQNDMLMNNRPQPALQEDRMLEDPLFAPIGE